MCMNVWIAAYAPTWCMIENSKEKPKAEH